MNPFETGYVHELRCKLYFMELGYTVSTPEKPTRYDFILDTGKELLRVQCKQCVWSKEKLTFHTTSVRIMKKHWAHPKYKLGEIDYFCTWANGECYLVPIEECFNKTEKSLRFEPTKNCQTKFVSYAKDYVARDVLKKRIQDDGNG